jgi:hypothetical protein
MSDLKSGSPTSGFRHFKERPSQVFVDKVCKHLADTGQPETFDDLFRDNLEKDEPFLRLQKIIINTKIRPNRDLAPCPRCHSSNKFKEGWLVYLHERGAVAVVGNECASGEAQEAADREWEARQQRTKDEDYLLAAIPRIPTWLSEIDEVIETADAVVDFATTFRKDGREYFKQIQSSTRQAGRLKVTQVLKNGGEGPRGIRSSGSNVETVDHEVGTLNGLPMVKPSFNPAKTLREVAAELKKFVQSGEDAAFHYVADMPVNERRLIAAHLKQQSRRALSASKDLIESRNFLSNSNVELLDRWGQHPYADFRFSVQLNAPEKSGHRRFEIKGKPYFQHRVRPEFWARISELRFDGPD